MKGTDGVGLDSHTLTPRALKAYLPGGYYAPQPETDMLYPVVNDKGFVSGVAADKIIRQIKR